MTNGGPAAFRYAGVTVGAPAGLPRLPITPLDARLRGNDEWGAACVSAHWGNRWGAGGFAWHHCHPSGFRPAIRGYGMYLCRNDEWGAGCFSARPVDLRGAARVCRASLPPLWIPASTGMTNGGRPGSQCSAVEDSARRGACPPLGSGGHGPGPPLPPHHVLTMSLFIYACPRAGGGWGRAPALQGLLRQPAVVGGRGMAARAAACPSAGECVSVSPQSM